MVTVPSDAVRSMSSNPDQILTAFAERIAGYALETLGRDDILSIFIAGSVARGQIAAFEDSGFTEIYSDIDMYIVVSDRVDLEASRRKIREFAAGVPREAHEFRIFPAPDVGVYSRALLDAQQVRPGTVEIKSAHRVLWGGEDIPGGCGRFSAAAIHPTEGLYLLENRLAEMAESGVGSIHDGDAGYRRYVHYTLLKSWQDLLSAALIVLGRYNESRTERMRMLGGAEWHENAGGLLTLDAVDAIHASHMSLSNLRSVIDSDANELAASQLAVESALLTGWRTMGERISGAVGRSGWAEIMEWRCRVGKWRSNTRELLRLGKRMSVPRGRLVLRLGRLARLSPVEALRLSGMAELLLSHGEQGGIEIEPRDRDELIKGYAAFLDELTGGFQVRQGSVFQRGRRLFRMTT